MLKSHTVFLPYRHLPLSFRLFLFSLGLLLLIACEPQGTSASLDEAVTQIPNPQTLDRSWVSDPMNVLQNKDQINQVLQEEESRSGNEIAIVICQSIGDFVPKDFAVALFKHWGIGKKGKENGILVLHVLDQRRIEIETGYGLEGDLPDVKVKRIINTYSLPAFGNDEFSKGHLETALALVSALQHPEREVDKLLSSETPDIDYESDPTYQRSDYYDFGNKSYTSLSDKEKEILEKILQNTQDIPAYFLTDDEIRLSEERYQFQEEQRKANEIQWKYNFLKWYVFLAAIVFFIQKVFERLPFPNAKYYFILKVNPLLYLLLGAFPVFLLLFTIHYFFGESSIFPCIVVSVFLYVILHTIINPIRLRRLAIQLKEIRKTPRDCKKCGSTMSLLNEISDNEYLSSGQIAEEEIDSIDYDVWACNNCNSIQVLKFRNIDPSYIQKGISFPKIKVCPECKFETFLHKKSKILSKATTSSSGKVQVERQCKHCGFEKVETLTIPKIRKSGSGSGSGGGGGGGSSGGSFGGGSSGGGGSGGSY